MEQKIRVGVISDNFVFLNGLCKITASHGRYEVVLKSNSKERLLNVFENPEEEGPELIIISTDEMCQDTELMIAGIKAVYPHGKVLIMSNYNNQYNIVKALRYGANGYLSRGCDGQELHRALLSIYYTDIYYNESYSGVRIGMSDRYILENVTNITELEREALTLFATEMSYKEIADTMNTSVEIVEAYRDLLFEKFKVKSRVGLVVWAHAIGELSISRKSSAGNQTRP